MTSIKDEYYDLSEMLVYVGAGLLGILATIVLLPLLVLRPIVIFALEHSVDAFGKCFKKSVAGPIQRWRIRRLDWKVGKVILNGVVKPKYNKGNLPGDWVEGRGAYLSGESEVPCPVCHGLKHEEWCRYPVAANCMLGWVMDQDDRDALNQWIRSEEGQSILNKSAKKLSNWESRHG
jgi:hypothetical protein